MNPAADPIFVAAEVAYRFERDRVGSTPEGGPRPTGRLRGLLARLVLPSRQHTRARARARNA